ncbi:MAG: type II toxin-antitoxin system HicA family toxin [Candidatus Latescibacter sp.]|nr:type II toxin-antitoxin system HicA family toxin [Candidatus Latescibacter sp.]
MKLPRDVSGDDLIRALSHMGYTPTRQTGSHVRLTTDHGGVHHITIPLNDPLKIGMLNALVKDIGEHHGLTRNEVLSLLFQ